MGFAFFGGPLIVRTLDLMDKNDWTRHAQLNK